ncbi:MAG: hypothetical protein M1820_004528 [Bogoriella megaspora]|nr:MAG: hypothetical protein M1820_004528 [Bogoriella megaspora]
MPRTLSLSVLDQFGARAYVRLAVIWPFDNSRETDAIAKIRNGLQCAFTCYPYLAGNVVETCNQAGEPSGYVELHYPDRIDEPNEPQFRVNHLSKKEFPYTYEELDAEGVPGTKLPNELLTKTANIPDLTKPQPAVTITLNFIEGGLILHVSFLHIIGDGTGMGLLLNRFCRDVRLRTDPNSVVREDIQARSPPLLINSPLPRNKGTTRIAAPIGWKEVIEPVAPFPLASPILVPPLTGARIFTFSDDFLKELRERLNGFGNFSPDYITKTDCVNALLWFYVTRARFSNQSYPFGNTTHVTAVNIRSRIGQHLLGTYTGNATMLAQTTTPIEEFLLLNGTSSDESSEGSPSATSSPIPIRRDSQIAELHGVSNFKLENTSTIEVLRTLSKAATQVHECVRRVDDRFVQERLSFFATTSPKYARYSFRNYLGPDFFLTSWAGFGADTEWGIPGTLTKHPAWIRKPYLPDDGSSVILPRRKDAPWEVWVQLKEEHLEKLSQMDSLGGWADRVV